MTATAIQTPPRLDIEPTGGVFPFLGDVQPPPATSSGGGGGCDLPPPAGPLARLVRDIFSSTVHGSPSAPVLVSPHTFPGATALRATDHTTNPATKGTA